MKEKKFSFHCLLQWVDLSWHTSCERHGLGKHGAIMVINNNRIGYTTSWVMGPLRSHLHCISAAIIGRSNAEPSKWALFWVLGNLCRSNWHGKPVYKSCWNTCSQWQLNQHRVIALRWAGTGAGWTRRDGERIKKRTWERYCAACRRYGYMWVFVFLTCSWHCV